MANYISIGHEFINLDRVGSIQVYTATDNTVIACGSCEEGPVSP